MSLPLCPQCGQVALYDENWAAIGRDACPHCGYRPEPTKRGENLPPSVRDAGPLTERATLLADAWAPDMESAEAAQRAFFDALVWAWELGRAPYLAGDMAALVEGIKTAPPMPLWIGPWARTEGAVLGDETLAPSITNEEPRASWTLGSLGPLPKEKPMSVKMAKEHLRAEYDKLAAEYQGLPDDCGYPARHELFVKMQDVLVRLRWLEQCPLTQKDLDLLLARKERDEAAEGSNENGRDK